MNSLSALSGKVIIITGSSRGIGREVARTLLAAGATVVINGRNRDQLQQTQRQLTAWWRESGNATGVTATGPARNRDAFDPPVQEPPLTTVVADVSTEEGAQQLVQVTLETWKRVDGLVNNAGLSMRGSIADLRKSTIDRLYAGNILSAILPTIAVIPELVRTGGTVVFVTTVSAMWGFPGVSMYSATKNAVESFARSLDAEYRRQGVRVSCVFLGFVENDPDKEVLSSDGTLRRHARKAHLTQSEAATAISGALLRPRRRIHTIIAGRLLGLVARVMPSFIAYYLSRSESRLHRVEYR